MPGILNALAYGKALEPNQDELTYRSSMLPIGAYRAQDGHEYPGLAWPGMITEPINALSRLAQNSRLPDGSLGIPNPQNQENKDDMVTALLSMYGGNALNPMRGGAVRTAERAATHDMPLFDMSEGRGSQTLNGSRVRYGVDDRGVYVYDLETPQAEAGRGQARSLMEGLTRSADEAGLPITLDAQPWGEGTNVNRLRNFYRSLGFEPVDSEGMMRRNALLSDTGKPSILGAALAGESRILDPGDYIPSSAWEGTKSAKQTQAGLSSTPTPFHKDYLLPERQLDDADREFARMTNTIAVEYPDNIQTPFENPYDRALAEQAWRDKIKRTGELYSDTGRPSLMGAALASEQSPQGIIAYHGSPHDFDRFDLSKIGTGEGAQAFGHGLYFADNENVAKTYRDNLAGKDVSVYGKPVTRWGGDSYYDNVMNDYVSFDNGNMDSVIGRLMNEKAELERRGSAVGDGSGMMEDLLSTIEKAKKIKEDNAAKVDTKGHMYQVRINANPDDFLDWDKPLSQQSEKVRNAAIANISKDVLRTAKDAGWHDYQPNIEEILNMPGLSAVPRRPEELSAFREAGVPGVRYLDQMSRDAGDGSRNYAVFDDSLIEILKKYGWLPPAAYASSLLDFNTDQQY